MSEIQISPAELKQKLDAGASVVVVDVREPWEHMIGTIDGAKLVPMNSIPENLSSLEGAEEVVLYCHHGARSLNAAAWLRQQGIEGARSLTGGIERWSTEIDPKIPHY